MPLSASPLRRWPASSAFTLVEVLTVIAIIGVLTSILVITIGRARDSARSTQCLSNLRQIGTAIQLYANDNRGILPGPLYGGQDAKYNTHTGGSPGVLAKILEPYSASQVIVAGQALAANERINSLFLCPAWEKSKASGDVANNGRQFLLNSRPWAVSHGQWDIFPFGDSNSAAGSPRGTPRKYLSLSEFPLARSWALIDVDRPLMDAIGNTSDWAAGLPAKPVHGNTRNVLYYDWHVGKVPATTNVPSL